MKILQRVARSEHATETEGVKTVHHDVVLLTGEKHRGKGDTIKRDFEASRDFH